MKRSAELLGPIQRFRRGDHAAGARVQGTAKRVHHKLGLIHNVDGRIVEARPAS